MKTIFCCGVFRYQAVCKIMNEVDPTSSTLTLREGEFDLKIFTKVALSEVNSATVIFGVVIDSPF